MTHRPWKAVVVLLALASTGALADWIWTPNRALFKPRSATVLPTECLAERNQGACVNCCKALVDVPGNVCSHFCNSYIPPPSEEPKP